MRNYLILIALFFSMCKSNQMPQQEFEGSFKGTMNGYASTSELSVDGNILTGSVSMNGEVAIVTGTVNGTYCEGKIIDNNTLKAINQQLDEFILWASLQTQPSNH